MASIGSLFFDLRANDAKLTGDITKSAGKAGATAGTTASKSFGAKFSSGIKGMGSTIKAGIGSGIMALGGPIGIATTALSMFTDFAGEAIAAASDLAESQSKANVVFGESAEVISDWAETAAQSMGASKQAALEMAGTLGNLFTSMGLTQEASADMSMDVVQLGADLASFNNLAGGTEEALEKLRSGLVGEAEPLRALGINLSAAAVEQEALASGLVKTKKEITDSVKVQARWNLIVKQSKNAAGDFARTSDGLANSQRIANAEMDNMRAEIGQKLMPVFQQATRIMHAAIGPLAGAATFALGAFLDYAKGVFEQFRILAEQVQNIQDLMDPRGAQVREWLEEIKRMPEAVGHTDETLKRFINTHIDLGHSLEVTKRILREGKELWTEQADAMENARLVAETYAKAWLTLPGTVENGIDILTREQKAFLDGLRDTEKQALLELEDLPASLRFFLEQEAAAEVEEGAKVMLAPILQQTKLAKKQAEEQARLIPGSVADAMREKFPEVREAAQDLRYTMTHPLRGAKEIAAIEGRLTGRRMARAIRRARNDPAVKHDLDLYLQTILDRLRLLKSLGYDVGVEIGLALSAGLASDPRVKAFRDYAKKNKLKIGGSLYDLLEIPTGQDRGRQAGGPVMAGQAYVVGETRPELFIPRQSGYVMPSVNAMAGNLTITVKDPDGGLARAGIGTGDLAGTISRFLRGANRSAGLRYTESRA